MIPQDCLRQEDPRVVLGFGVAWWAVFTTLITFVSSKLTVLIGALIAIRFLLGVGEAVVYPASNCIVSAWIPSAERGIANGIIFAGVGFGAGLAPPLITYMLVRHGWRSSFWISALLGLIVGTVWCFIARDKPANHPWISARELNYILIVEYHTIETKLPRNDCRGSTSLRIEMSRH